MQKILIIEDEEALLSILSEKLDREGYEIASAKDGEGGLKKLKEGGADLVLLDIVMPKMNGMEVLEKIRTDKEIAKTLVIIISNSGQPVEIEKAKTLGIKDYLIKAEFDPQELVDKVNDALKHSSDEETNQSAAEDGGEEKRKIQNKKRKEKSASGSKRSDANAGAPSVLVVEDDQFLRDLLVKKLEEEGFKVSQAIDGGEALRLVKESKPDLILLDLVLPGIDGLEVLKQLKDDSATADIAVLILSNLDRKEEINRGLKLGAKDYLIKAYFTPGEIVEKARRVIR